MEIQVGAGLAIPADALTDEYKELLSSLTVRNPEYARKSVFGGGYTGNIPEFLHFYKLDKVNKVIYVPRNIPSKYYSGQKVETGLTWGFSIGRGDKDKAFKLWEDQQEFMNQVEAENLPDVMLNAKCGTGKTIMSLYRANKLETSTVIAVTTREIGEQFLDAVREYFPAWSCGWAKDGSFDITVGTYALFSADDYDEEYFGQFGHLILDEFHRAGAPEFGKVLMKAPCAYRTTLSATFRRKDGMEKVLIHHVGKVFTFARETKQAVIQPIDTEIKVERNQFRPIGNRIKEPNVGMEVALLNIKTSKEVIRGFISEIDDTSITVEGYLSYGTQTFDKKEVSVRKLLTFSRTIFDSHLADSKERVAMIFSLIRKCRKDGRVVLVLSNRKSLLYSLEKLCTKFGITNGVISSAQDDEFIRYCKKQGRKPADQKKWCRLNASVILGIDKIAEEGLDIPRLDTIIYTYAMDDIEQSVGRILRTHEGKKDPMALYLVDDFAGSKANFQKAKMMFNRLGHDVRGTITWEKLWSSL